MHVNHPEGLTSWRGSPAQEQLLLLLSISNLLRYYNFRDKNPGLPLFPQQPAHCATPLLFSAMPSYLPLLVHLNHSSIFHLPHGLLQQPLPSLLAPPSGLDLLTSAIHPALRKNDRKCKYPSVTPQLKKKNNRTVELSAFSTAACLSGKLSQARAEVPAGLPRGKGGFALC